MGLWEIIRKMPAPSPNKPEFPIYRDYSDPLGDVKTVGDIVDGANNIIKGTRNAIRKVLSIFDDEESRKLRKGDVIGICRGTFDHYGVYVDDSSVIHYSSPKSDTASDNAIIETSLEDFMRGDDTLFRLSFPDEYGRPRKIVADQSFAPDYREFERLMAEWRIKCAQYRLQTPDETVERARSRLGEKAYSLCFNNCEHFAIWCKTDISESHQVNDLLEILRPRLNY